MDCDVTHLTSQYLCVTRTDNSADPWAFIQPIIDHLINFIQPIIERSPHHLYIANHREVTSSQQLQLLIFPRLTVLIHFLKRVCMRSACGQPDLVSCRSYSTCWKSESCMKTVQNAYRLLCNMTKKIIRLYQYI